MGRERVYKYRGRRAEFTGVFVRFGVRKNLWNSQIKVNYKRIWLGYYDTAEEAYLAYYSAAKKYFGEYLRKDNYGEGSVL